MEAYPFNTLCSLIAVLIFAISTSASPAPGSGLIQARFNCPKGPAPAGINQYLYRDFYIFCISGNADCDCYPVAGQIAQLNLYEVRCRRPVFVSYDNLQMLAAVGDCREKCMCYGGPAENWVKYPYGPGSKGPSIEAPVGQAANPHAETA